MNEKVIEWCRANIKNAHGNVFAEMEKRKFVPVKQKENEK